MPRSELEQEINLLLFNHDIVYFIIVKKRNMENLMTILS